jgi:hypothetical protein
MLLLLLPPLLLVVLLLCSLDACTLIGHWKALRVE